jgi:Tfp pilus assembly protein PilF
MSSNSKELVEHATLTMSRHGDHAAAIHILDQVLTTKPCHARANFLKTSCRLQQAVSQHNLHVKSPTYFLQPILTAVAHSPSKPFLHYGLALVRATLGNCEWLHDAKRTIALSLETHNTTTLTAIGGLLRKYKEWSTAAEVGLQLVAWNPNNITARKNLATCFRRSNKLEKAREQYRAILDQLGQQSSPSSSSPGPALASENSTMAAVALIEHWLAACGGTSTTITTAAPPSFVRSLYDGYAHKFDDHLSKLEYMTPKLLTDALLAQLRPQESVPFANVCDLGCGTGLMMASMSKAGIVCTTPTNQQNTTVSIVGIDLSSGMIEQARNKQLYTQLEVGDMNNVLSTKAQYSLIVCCDV